MYYKQHRQNVQITATSYSIKSYCVFYEIAFTLVDDFIDECSICNYIQKQNKIERERGRTHQIKFNTIGLTFQFSYNI